MGAGQVFEKRGRQLLSGEPVIALVGHDHPRLRLQAGKRPGWYRRDVPEDVSSTLAVADGVDGGVSRLVVLDGARSLVESAIFANKAVLCRSDISRTARLRRSSAVASATVSYNEPPMS